MRFIRGIFMIRPYDRARDFPAITGKSPDGLPVVARVALLEKALAVQREYSRNNSWRYNLVKHMRIIMALNGERE